MWFNPIWHSVGELLYTLLSITYFRRDYLYPKKSFLSLLYVHRLWPHEMLFFSLQKMWRPRHCGWHEAALWWMVEICLCTMLVVDSFVYSYLALIMASRLTYINVHCFTVIEHCVSFFSGWNCLLVQRLYCLWIYVYFLM